MIKYENIQRYDGMDFETYLKLPGYSHSFLKSEINGVAPKFHETKKVRLGKIVDALLTGTPEEVNMKDELYPAAKALAFEIKTVFGSIIKLLSKQVSFTGDMLFDGLRMPTKCRLDYFWEQQAVIDLKVTHEKDVHGLIQYMGYENQLWNYSGIAKVERNYILIYSVPLKKTTLVDLGKRPERSPYWESRIQKFGVL